MDLRRLQKFGQAALEYILILTVVAVVVIIALKPSSSTPSTLNRVQVASEGYYNTVTQAIMGDNPKPIDGGWCPPKPNGERECACPQPQFGGASCSGQTSNIQYCGDQICNGGETGEPGHPINSSDPLFTCFEDCDYLPDCDQCANLIPSAGCGGSCGGNTCSGLQVCMTSDCPPGCAGYRAVCQDNPQLCSGSCRCNPDPGTRTEVSGCGIQSGTCTPTIYEKCFQFNDCTSSCTAEQRLQAVRVPECGKCPAQTYPVNCGPTGSVTIPETLNGQTGSVACPFGCTQRTMSALCTDGVFGVPSSPCIPAICEPLVYNTGICGNVTLPVTSPGLSTPDVLCPTGCTGFIKGDCPSGSATFSVSGTCIPNNCDPTSYPTPNCGPVDIPLVISGSSTTVSCPTGCSGNVTASCDRGNLTVDASACIVDCPNTSMVIGTCGTVVMPSTTSGSTVNQPCPGTCTGTVTAFCNNGVFDPPTNSCLADCLDLLVPAGSCGSTILTGAISGNTSVAGCPGGCTGTLSATCTNGSFGSVTNDCGCPTTTVSTSCGPTDLPPAPNGSSSPVSCPGSCTGTVSATCSSGTFGPITELCNANCPLTPVSTACGTVNLPAGVVSGNLGTAACPAGCSGAGVSATCNNGVYSSPTVSCTPDPCAGQSITTPCGSLFLPGVSSGNSSGAVTCPSGCTGSMSMSCLNGTPTISGTCSPLPCSGQSFPTPCGTATMTGVPSGNTGTATCPTGCVGGITALCTNGSWETASGSCTPAPCPPTPVTTSCGTFNLPSAPHNPSVAVDAPCTGLCSGMIHGTCNFGSYIGISNTCIAITCLANGEVNDSDTIRCPGPVFGSNVRIPASACCSGFARYTCLASAPSEINDISGVCSP